MILVKYEDLKDTDLGKNVLYINKHFGKMNIGHESNAMLDDSHRIFTSFNSSLSSLFSSFGKNSFSGMSVTKGVNYDDISSRTIPYPIAFRHRLDSIDSFLDFIE